VLLLSKKHGQLKQAITRMVQVAMDFLDDAPNTEIKLSVIETLRTVTEGKVSVHLSIPVPNLLLTLASNRSSSRLSVHE
jgi:hypothetical protein